MKAARLVVLTVALAAGGVAALLAGRSEKPPAPSRARRQDRHRRRPGRQSRHRHGPDDLAGDLHWQAWPASAAERQFHPQERSARRDRTAVGLDRARAVRRRRADPRSQAGQGQGLRLHGRDPAVRHARGFDADFAGNRRRRLHPAERSRRRHPDAARPRGRKGAGGESIPAKPFFATCACWRSTRPSRRRTARRSWSARPRRSNCRRARPKRWRLSQQLGTLSLALRSIADAHAKIRTPTTRPNAPQHQRGALRRQHCDDTR